jgi:hypothetical protein
LSSTFSQILDAHQWGVRETRGVRGGAGGREDRVVVMRGTSDQSGGDGRSSGSERSRARSVTIVCTLQCVSYNTRNTVCTGSAAIVPHTIVQPEVGWLVWVMDRWFMTLCDE